MRNLLKFAAVLLLVVASAATNAQTLKFGHVDLRALIQIMPEYAKMGEDLNKYQKDMEEILAGMTSEYQQKLTEFEQLAEETSEVKRNAKITEIQELQTKIENYRNNAYTQIQQKEQELLQPILEKAQAAIEEVAKAQGVFYVFDVQALLYKSNQSIDMFPLAKEKLGIQ